MDTKYPANSLHSNRSFRGTFSIQIKTALQCVSLGNVDPACVQNCEKTCLRNPESAARRVPPIAGLPRLSELYRDAGGVEATHITVCLTQRTDDFCFAFFFNIKVTLFPYSH